MKISFNGKKLEILLFIILILTSSYLRFKNLGYSEYQDDERKAMMTIQNEEFSTSFLLSQRKGPMQFLVTRAISFFVPDWRNEVLYRIPFTTINLLSVVVVWAIFKRIFKNPITAFWGALIYSINGFVFGFSRIVQYQNLNLFFSLLSLYFFIRLYQDKKKPYLFSFLGTVSFCLSVFSHWDAIFFVVPIAYFYFAYILENLKEKRVKESILITVLNIALGCLILLPFLIPYTDFHKNDPDSMRYFSRRVDKSTYSLEKHQSIFELYNPYLAIYLLPILGVFSFFRPKKNLIWLVWFGVNFFLIVTYMKKPGTHVYNYVIPAIFMATAGIDILIKAKLKISRIFLIPIFILSFFLVYQTYILFVDNSPEYPWFDKKIISIGNWNLIAPSYDKKEILTFGFPHFRDWKSIAKIVNNDPENCSYITNEGLEIARIYLEIRNGILKDKNCYYVIKVKRPFNNQHKDSHFDMGRNRYKVYSFIKEGERLNDLYKVYKETD